MHDTSPLRILLLAFSGVRVVDPELARLGMTLPGFAERARKIAALPSLGLLTLAAHTPAQFTVVYREIGDPAADTARAIAAEGFALVAISALPACIGAAYALADGLRALGVRVAIGGLHASTLSEEVAEHADAIVIGAGEAAWPRLCSDLESGRLAARYETTARDSAKSFAGAPVPRFDLLDVSRYDRFTVQTMRGCPLDCSFCGASRLLGPFQRKPLAQVERELEAALRSAPGRRLELADDNTFADAKRGRELARALSASGARWFTETDLSVAEDPELVREIARSGCAGLLIGLESARRDSLDAIDSRRWKAGQVSHHGDKIAALQSSGIPVTGCFVIGFDEDGPDVFEATFSAVRALDLAEVQVTLLTPFPGTALFAQLEREGRLDAQPFWNRLTLFDLVYEPARMRRSELVDGFKELVRALHAPAESERRARRRRACLRESSRRARRRGSS